MEGYSDTVDLYTESLNQAGIANKKFELYQKGTEAQVTKLKNAMTDVWATSFNSETIRDITISLTSLTSGLKSFIETFGLLPAVLTTATLAYTLYNKELLASTILMGQNTTSGIMNFLANTSKMSFTLAGATSALANFGTKLASIGRFLIGISWPIAAILGVGYGIQKLTGHFKELEEQQNNIREGFNKLTETNTATQKEIDEITQLKNEYDSLKNITVKTEEEKNKFISVQKRLADLMPGVSKSLDEEGNIIIANTKSIEDQIQKKEELIKKNNQLAQVKFNQDAETMQDGIEEEKQRLDYLDKRQKEIVTNYEKLQLAKTTSSGQVVLESGVTFDKDDALNKYSEELEKVTSEYEELQSNHQDSISSFQSISTQVLSTNKNFEELGTTLNSNIIKAFDELSDVSMKKFINSIKDSNLPTSIKNIQSSISDLNNNTISFEDFDRNIIEQVTNIENVIVQKLGKSKEEASNFAKSIIGSISPMAEARIELNSLAEANNNIKNIMSQHSPIINEYNNLLRQSAEGYVYTKEEMNNLIARFPELNGKFVEQDGYITLNVNSLGDLIVAHASTMNAGINGQNSLTSVVSAQTLARMNAYGLEIDKLKDLAEAQYLAGNLASKQTGGFGDAGVRNSLSEGYYKEFANYLKLKELAEKKLEIPNINSIGGGKSDSSSAGGSTAKNKDYENSISSIELAIKKLQIEREKLTSGSNEYRNSLQQEITLNQQKLDLINQEISKTTEQDKILQLQGQKLDLLKEIDSITKSIRDDKILELDNAISNLNDQISISESRMKLYETGTRGYNEELALQIKLTKDLSSELKIKEQLILKELQNDKLSIKEKKELITTLQNLKKTQIDAQVSLSSLLRQSASNAIDALKKSQEKELKRIEDKIKKEEEYYDKRISHLKDELKLLEEQYEAEDRMLKLKELNDEIDKVKADKRFSYITAEGEEILTYDKGKVSELELQKDEMLRQFQREDIKQAIQSEIDRLEKAKDRRIEILNKELERTKEIHAEEIEDMETKWNTLIELSTLGQLSYDELIANWHELSLENQDSFHSESLESIKKYVDEAIAQYKRLAGYSASPGSSSGGGGGSGWGAVGDTNGDGIIDNSGNTDYVPSDPGGSSLNPPGFGTNSKTTTKTNTTSSYSSNDDFRKKNGLSTKHTGGTVGSEQPSKLTQIANKLFNAKPNEEVILALKKELFVPEQNIANNFIPNMRNLISSFIPSNSNQPQITNNNKYFNFKDITVKANDMKEFIRSMEFYVTSNQS